MARWTIRQKIGDHEKRYCMDGPRTEDEARKVFVFEQAGGHRPEGAFTVEPRDPKDDESPIAKKFQELFTASLAGKPVPSAVPVDFKS
jgi:hypothetical protein